MSDKPIQVGDLVMVIRPSGCTNCEPRFGRIGTVVAITPERTPKWECAGCGRVFKKYNDNSPKITIEDGRSYQAWRLKRIDPPALLESTRTEETLKEPA